MSDTGFSSGGARRFDPDRIRHSKDPKEILRTARAKFVGGVDDDTPTSSVAPVSGNYAPRQQDVGPERSASPQQQAMRMIRKRVEKLVWPYILLNGDAQHATWGRIYKELDWRHGFNVYEVTTGDLTPLDAVERAGLMAQLHVIALSVCV